MSTKKMKNKKIIIIAFSLTMIHFAFPSLIGYYIAAQAGTEMGRIVADGLMEASNKDPDEAKEAAAIIYQNMKTKSDAIIDSWKIPQLLISLPTKVLITPLLKDVRKQQMNKVIAKEITREQFRTHGLMIDYTVNFLNSLSLGFLVYVGSKLLYRYNP